MKTCRNALLRRAAGARNRTTPYVLLSHIAIPWFLGKWKVDPRVFQFSCSDRDTDCGNWNTRGSTFHFPGIRGSAIWATKPRFPVIPGSRGAPQKCISTRFHPKYMNSVIFGPIESNVYLIHLIFIMGNTTFYTFAPHRASAESSEPQLIPKEKCHWWEFSGLMGNWKWNPSVWQIPCAESVIR